MRTNTKIVSNMIQEHIKEYYTVEELREQVKALQYPRATQLFSFTPSIYYVLDEMVQGGCFLIYYEDVKNFLNELGINPNGKEYDDVKSWDLYKHLIAREGAKLCDIK